jgi:glycosyltransferase involved in cell wall biosynthesis
LLVAGIYLLFSLLYTGLIWFIYRGWLRTSEAVTSDKATCIKFSIIIPARNESAHVVACIQAIQTCEYPKECYEIILIDDHSTDDTAEKIRNFADSGVRMYTLPEGKTGKKEAISYGVSMARHAHIICTDADCVPGKDWIKSHAAAFSNQEVHLTTGIVMPLRENTVLDHFQWMDFAATMVLTAAGIKYKAWFLANGANFGFTKDFFYQAGGYSGNSHIASGDDVFMIQKAAAIDPNKIVFVKSQTGLVITQPVSSWTALCEQRKRWATKAFKTKGDGVVLIQEFVFILSLLIVSGILIGWILHEDLFLWAGIALGLKMIVDYVFLIQLARYYGQKVEWLYFLPSFLLYLFHILYSGYQAMFPGSYTWKSRKQS